MTVRETVEHVVEMFEEGTLPDKAESYHAAVDRQLEQWDLDETLEDVEGDLDEPLDAKASEEAIQALKDLDSDLAKQVEEYHEDGDSDE